jgi:putative NADPH-quinone reductase
MSMTISLILGHPRPDSFCHAIAATAVTTLRTNGHVVAFHDLYAEGFPPLVTAEESRTRVSDDPLVEQHCAELTRAEGLIVVHPNWWGYPPAILKGWIDRVIRPGVAYELAVEASGARTLHVGRLHVRTAVVFNTSDTPVDQEQTRFGDTLGSLWKNYIAPLSGIPDLQRHVFSVMATSTPAMRVVWSEEVRSIVHRAFPATSAVQSTA